MQNNRILSFNMAKVLEAKEVEQVGGAGAGSRTAQVTYQGGEFDVNIDTL